MRSGLLRHRITIRRSSLLQDPQTGDFSTVWQTVAQPYASVEGLNGREATLGKALQGISSYKITIRYRDGLLDSDQITLSMGETLNVTSAADPDGLRKWLVVLAETGSARGEGSGE